MKAEEILQNVKKIVFGETPETPAAPAEKVFSEYQLKDGSMIEIDELQVGGVVMVSGSPAPAGSHELADGTIIEVGEGGVISAITAPAPPEEPVAEDMSKYEERFASIESKFAAIETELTSTKQENESLKQAFAKADEAIKGLVSLVETLVKDGGEPINQPRQGFKHQGETKEEKLTRLLNINPYKK